MNSRKKKARGRPVRVHHLGAYTVRYSGSCRIILGWFSAETAAGNADFFWAKPSLDAFLTFALSF
jgi:hypothetical protein